MTDYSTLPPGPELDALVAEKVMGWTKQEDGAWTSPRSLALSNYPWQNYEAIWDATRWPYGDDDHPEEVWSPSTNIAHAFEVVDEMARRSFHFEMDVRPRRGSCASFKSGDCKHHSLEIDETPPPAISRAALAPIETNK